MILLILFAFLAGVVTILSPCILPVLPIIFSGTVDQSKRKPLGIVTGFIISFTFFTLSLSSLVKLTGIPADSLRLISVIVIAGFGLSLLIPQFQILMEKLFSKLSGAASTQVQKSGFLGGVILGVSLGLVWTPCVGPIIASVITLAATSSINLVSVLITLAYSIGTAVPMLLIIFTGRRLFEKFPWLTGSTGAVQKVFGILMILTAIEIYFNFDRSFQTWVLEKFPNYGVGLTKFENRESVKNELEKVKSNKINSAERLQLFGGNPLYPQAPEIIPGGEWINSQPLKLSDLRGKVVLVDFWTYTCINCIRTLPYLKSWYEKYADKGLVIIGVHTPEFEFEKEAANVKKAIEDFKIKYPVVQDNNYATWRAYNNQYWPAKYFIDKEGKIRSTHFGEGEYDESEKIIQELLSETGKTVSDPINNPTYKVETQTPETYLGYKRIEYLDSPEKVQSDKKAIYSIPSKVLDNRFAFSGEWTVTSEMAMPGKGSELLFNFYSKEVYLVMKAEKETSLEVYLDGVLVESGAGEDAKQGKVTVAANRLYKLIKLATPGKHLLKLKFLDEGVEAYAFTFG